MSAIDERRAYLLSLGPNWDSYGANPIDEATLDRAIDCARLLSHEPAIVPAVDGGAQLEWHGWGWDVEIEFCPDGQVVTLVHHESLPEQVDAEAAIAARDALLDQALELLPKHWYSIHDGHACDSGGECDVAAWRRAVTELRGGA